MVDAASSGLAGPRNTPESNGLNVDEIRQWAESDERFGMLADEIARLRRECKSRRKFATRFAKYVAETESLRAQAQNRLDRIHQWYDETDSVDEQAKHPEQFDMWITGYEQAMLDVHEFLLNETDAKAVAS